MDFANIFKEGSTFSIKAKNFSFNADMSCTVKNVICITECRGCQKLYIHVRETNSLSKRTTLHNQHIRHENLGLSPVNKHISTCSDKDAKYFMFSVLYDEF